MRADGSWQKPCAFLALVPKRIEIDTDLQFGGVKKVCAGGIAQSELPSERSFNQLNSRRCGSEDRRQLGAQRSIKGATGSPAVRPIAGCITAQVRTEIAVKGIFVGEFTDPSCGKVLAVSFGKGGQDRAEGFLKLVQGL